MRSGSGWVVVWCEGRAWSGRGGHGGTTPHDHVLAWRTGNLRDGSVCCASPTFRIVLFCVSDYSFHIFLYL